jgi:hypothetical protein
MLDLHTLLERRAVEVLLLVQRYSLAEGAVRSSAADRRVEAVRTRSAGDLLRMA